MLTNEETLPCNFYKEVIRALEEKEGEIVLIWHILPDCILFIDALAKIFSISLIIPIPYSMHKQTLEQLSEKYPIAILNLEELQNKETLLQTLVKNITPSNKKIFIMEIGGYSTAVLTPLKIKWGDLFLGVIEDTEAGHRCYAQLQDKNQLPVPVISVARSPLKAIEDSLIGYTCFNAFLSFLQPLNYAIANKNITILGYGKIGKSIAKVAKSLHLNVKIYDIDPIKSIQAMADGYELEDRTVALRSADIILGATGSHSLNFDDLKQCRSDVIIASCSSKRKEFDFYEALEHTPHENIAPYITRYDVASKKCIYLIANGEPVNLINGLNLIGSVISLLHAELIHSVNTLFEKQNCPGLYENSETQQQHLARLWLSTYKHGTSDCYTRAVNDSLANEITNTAMIHPPGISKKASS